MQPPKTTASSRGLRIREKLIGVTGFLALLGTALCFQSDIRREIFIARSLHSMRSIGNEEDARRQSAPGKIALFTLENGKWAVAAAEYSCCSGAGYNAVIVRDSDGNEAVDRQLSLCGGMNTIDGPRTGTWTAKDEMIATRVLHQLWLDYGHGQ